MIMANERQRSHSSGPRNKMGADGARKIIHIDMDAFMRLWSSETILSSWEARLWSLGAGIARSYAPLRMKRESSECVLLCRQFVPDVCALMQYSCRRTSRVIGRYPARCARSSNAHRLD